MRTGPVRPAPTRKPHSRAALVPVSGCARACHPCHHPSLHCWPRAHALPPPPPAIKMRSSGRCLPSFLRSFLPSATKNAHATTMTREAEPRPRRDKKPSERKEKGRASKGCRSSAAWPSISSSRLGHPLYWRGGRGSERQQSVRREEERRGRPKCVCNRHSYNEGLTPDQRLSNQSTITVCLYFTSEKKKGVKWVPPASATNSGRFQFPLCIIQHSHSVLHICTH